MKNLLVFLLFATSLFSTQITLNSLNGQTYLNNYVGPVKLSLFDNYAWCFDNTRNINVGQTWNVNILTFDELERAYFTNFTDFKERYKRIAFLGTLFNSTPASEWGYIQYAIWNVFNDLNTPNNSRINYYLNLPNTLTNYDNFRVVVDVNSRLQGFLVTVPKNTPQVPEPHTYALIGTSLIGLVFLKKR